MKKGKTTNDTPNTEGGQIVNNYAPIQKQINIHTLNGNISNIPDEIEQPFKSNIAEIKKAIAQSETDKALILLMDFLKKHHKDKLDDAVLIESRWQHLKKEKYKGVVDDEAYNISKNRIHESLISFLNGL